jgi:hypothetical protein
MTNGALITNNAKTHPPESWAAATSGLIFNVGATVSWEKRIPAMLLQAKLAEALVSHHANIQTQEKASIATDETHLMAPHAVEETTAAAVIDLQTAATGTEWEASFKDPDMVAQITTVLHNHFATAQHIERHAWALDNPTSVTGQAFLAHLHGEG